MLKVAGKLVRALLLMLVVVVATRGGGDKPGNAGGPSIPGAGASDVPARIDVMPPPNMDRKMAKDWEKLVRDLQHNDFTKARDRLDEFEHKYGESDESSALRAQLDRLPPAAYQQRGRDEDD